MTTNEKPVRTENPPVITCDTIYDPQVMTTETINPIYEVGKYETKTVDCGEITFNDTIENGVNG